MNTPNPVYDQGVDSAALARMSELFDRAAEAARVSPKEFRDGIQQAIAYARKTDPKAFPDNLMPEAAVLSLVCQLF